ncbi:hypothetical protein [Tenacibaculum aiptasiae]|uniref:hypothetical protein n=1 Tax=Tenacibaculum aiptasiae TaxID=426481 RepID=UPI003B5BD4AE
MKKILPIIYIAIGIFILVNTFSRFSQDLESYRVILNFKTENKYIFVLIRVLFAGWFLIDGVKKLKQINEEE